MKMSCTDTFFCILFQSLIRIQDNKRKKGKRTTGEKNTKTQEDAMEVITMRDNKNYKLSLQFSVKVDIKFVKNVIQT